MRKKQVRACLQLLNRKFFRVACCKIFIVVHNLPHISLHIARRVYGARADYFPFCVIYSVEQYGKVCLERYEIEPTLPLANERACAFWRDGKAESAGLTRLFGQLVSEAGMAASLHWDAAEMAEEQAKRPKKPLLFHKEI